MNGGVLLHRAPRHPLEPILMNTAFYLSGKITGTENGNIEKFQSAENAVRFQFGTGVMVINPHMLTHNHDKTWESYMKHDLRAMLKCNAVIVLDDWRNSRGAIVEILLAQLFDIPVFEMRGQRVESSEPLKISGLRMLQMFAKVLFKRF